ncbi:MAG: X2-like carbohydrate binding domain-containing protein, partial [Chitinophagales bacterium]
IYFTDVRDDSVGGDSDNAAASPGAGWWKGINFYDGSSGSLDNCVVQYSGYNDGWWGGPANVYKSGSGSLMINHCQIRDCSTYGIRIENTDDLQTVTNNYLRNNSAGPIYIQNAPNVTQSNNDTGVATISPTDGDFDKNVANQTDITTSLNLSGTTLISIANDDKPLVLGDDYEVSGTTVTIKKEYLAKQPVGVTTINFNFSEGSPAALTIRVTDTTPPTAPLISKPSITEITPTSARASANITSDGGKPITVCGIYYGTTANPVEDGTKVSAAENKTGAFSIDISNLTPNTLYHVIAFATNDVGTSQSERADFTTAAIQVAGVTVDKDTLTLEAGGVSATLVATITPENATNKAVTWSSTDETVATVVDGLVTPHAAGEATITVRTEDQGLEDTCHVIVNQPVSGVALDRKTLNLVPNGNSSLLTALITPVGATNQNVTWTSTDETVATVVNGQVTPHSNGTATITVTTEDGNLTDSCQVTVGNFPDLSCSTPVITGDLYCGGKANINVLISNQGNLESPKSILRVFLDTKSGSIQLGKDTSIAKLKPTKTKTLKVKATLPLQLGSGQYRIRTQIEVPSGISEACPDNNQTRTMAEIAAPDLIVGSVSLSGLLISGKSTNVNVQISNTNNALAKGFTIKLYLAISGGFDYDNPPEICLGYKKVSKLEPGSITLKMKAKVPKGFVPEDADYYLIAVTDTERLVYEDDETNNTKSIKVSLQQVP